MKPDSRNTARATTRPGTRSSVTPVTRHHESTSNFYFRTFSLIPVFAVFFLPSVAWSVSSAPSALSDSLGMGATQQLRMALERQEARLAVEGEEAQAASGHKKRGIRKFRFMQRLFGEGITTHKFRSYIDGVEVIGGQSFFHRAGNESWVQDSLAAFDVTTSARISPEEAASIAQGFGPELRLLEAPALKILPSDFEDSAKLVYVVRIEGSATEAGRDVTIDAQSGEVLADISHHQEIVPPSFAWVTVREAGENPCQTVGEDGAPRQLNVARCPITYARGKPRGTIGEASRNAATNATTVAKYFKNKHSRDSYDGKGSELVSIVRVGKKFSNAFWSSAENIMGYGEGDGVTFGDFTRSLDVAGHEMTHGVTSNSAGLIYRGESGALNEAFSDYFGAVIAGGKDWTIGKALYLDQTKARGIRDLANPRSLTYRSFSSGKPTPYPAHMKDKLPDSTFCNQLNDNCWVHINSTIMGHAFYQIHKAIGVTKAAKLIYTVLTQFLDERAKFADARQAFDTACPKVLNDATSCQKMAKAFAKVGL